MNEPLVIQRLFEITRERLRMNTYDDGQSALIVFGIILVIMLTVTLAAMLNAYYPNLEILHGLFSVSTLLKLAGFSWSG